MYWSNSCPKTKDESGLNKNTGSLHSWFLTLCVYFLPFQVTPGWRVHHTARRPVQHLPQARWRCRRRQEQQKSARAICCEQVSANCLWELRQRRARASATWVETNIFIYPGLSRERTSKLWNIIGQAQNKRRAVGWSRQPNKCTFVKQRKSHNASQSYWWQNTLDNHNHA